MDKKKANKTTWISGRM